MILALVGLITSEIYILCCEQGRTYPTNMILLAIFTLCEAYFVSFICGLTAVTSGKQTVVIAALMTLGTAIELHSNRTGMHYLRVYHAN